MLFFPTLKLPAHYIIGWEIGVKRFFCELAPKSGRVKNGSFTDRFSETGGWLKIDLVASSLSSFSNATICWPRWKHHFHNTPPPHRLPLKWTCVHTVIVTAALHQSQAEVVWRLSHICKERREAIRRRQLQSIINTLGKVPLLPFLFDATVFCFAAQSTLRWDLSQR